MVQYNFGGVFNVVKVKDKGWNDKSYLKTAILINSLTCLVHIS